MRRAARFPYIERDPIFGEFSRMPDVPLHLSANGLTVSVSALLDTGATLNVLPYTIGLQLGFVWEQQTTALRLAGNLAHAEARAVAIEATIAPFAPVLLAFAWTRAENAPLLLGQINFFQEFDVCFYRTKGSFTISPRPPR
jgi:hypothetical protein